MEYTLRGTLHQGAYQALYRALRCGDRVPVVLKVVDPRHCRPKDLERLRHEYEIGATLEPASIVKPLALDTYQDMPALVLEDTGGQPLDQLLGGPMSPERFLELAVRMAGAVAVLHRQGVVHKDLKPENILVEEGTSAVKLADFGIATRLSREQLPARPPALIEGSLPYMSPEQTGRINRALDSRTDLYSLGVTFYRMLTGHLPFDAHDPIEWVHSHVAREPSALSTEVPQQISRILLKLLAKMPEDRYQTARGLQRDLERCLESWRAAGRIEPFPLGERDVPDRLQIPQKLYGRDREIAALLAAFERVAGTTVPELVLVSGYSGIGKSSLIHELEKPIVHRNGLFIEGKFDQHKRDVPYSTIVQAFRQLVLDALLEGEERIADLRARLQAALGTNGQLVVGVIPELERLVGPQPPVPDLPPVEAQNRFRFVFRRFVGVFAQEEHPLTFFVDDLQWVDPASLALLEDLVTHPDVRSLLVLGAYRDNEVTPAHRLVSAVDSARRSGTHVSEVVLGPLSGEHLTALVADALHCRPTDAEPLAALVLEKTGANPFFVVQFLSVLYREGLVAFDAGAGRWRWDVARIRAQGYTDNVSELMVGKLRNLPAETQRALELAACIGATVDVDALATVCQRYPEPLVRPALEEDLLLRVEGAYRFPHDRVQEAAYSLIPETERAATHLRIGRLLLAHLPREQAEEKSFEIANQLNRGSALIDSIEEREQLAELNLISGLRAKLSTAYASALKYLAAGSALLGEDAWDRRYDLAFALELNRAECEYLTGDLDGAEQRLVALSRRARGLHVAAVASAQCDLYTTQGHGDRAVDAFLEYMRRIGVSWSPHPTKDEVRQEFERVWRQLGNRPIESIAHLRPMTDPAARATIEFMMWAHPPAQFFDENLGALAIGRMVNLSLEHGNSDASGLAYVWFGSLLGSQFADYEAGYRFGKVGLKLVEERRLLRFQSRVYVIFGALVIPHSRQVREGIPLIRRAYDTAREACDLSYACYARNALTTLLLAAGEPLGDVERETEDALHFVQKAKFGMMVDILENKLRLVRTLRGVTPLSASSYEEEEARLDAMLQGDRSLAIAVCWYFIRKLQERFYAGDHRAAAAAAARAEALLWTSPSFVEEAECRFYAALARAAQCDDAPPGERLRNLQAVATDRERLRLWEKHCPENFQDRYALVSAEVARIEGRELDAMRLYEQAIRSAHDNGFVQHEALAYELASCFYRARGYRRFADSYLREARACYLRWGADGKVKQLEQLDPTLVELRRPPVAQATFAARAEHLDLLSVVKASQTISGQIEIEQLAGTLLQIALEQGGARRGYLLLVRDGALSIEAEARLEGSEIASRMLPSVDVETSGLVPVSVIHRARRAREPVILDDASAAGGGFASDPYFARTTTRSVLCLPIVRQDLVGLLYLENDLVSGAFTPDRLNALSVLAAQAAISTENALHLARERAGRASAEFLSEAGALLSESLDFEGTLARLGPLCVRSLADWCVLDLLEGDRVRRLAGACADRSREPLIERLSKLYPARHGSPHPAARCLREGKPLWLPEISDDELRSLCVDDHHFDIVRELGTRSVLAVPLVARGTTLGVLSLASATPGRFRRAELELAGDVAHRAAMAIDNARLYRDAREAIQQRDESLRQLHELKHHLEEENLYLREEIDAGLGIGGMVGDSDALKYVQLRVRQVAPSDATVLIEGETGVGKELVARAIHEQSERAKGPFVRVNCAALPAQIIESELFGHEAGAFTGATRQRKGRFELADRGTLFLDEVGEMPLELQAKLLRVLEEGELERVGGTRTIRIDARTIAATNRQLREDVPNGRFREDLFYRLNVFPITVPPLRDRRDDIPQLVRHFVQQLAARTGRHIREIPAAFVRALLEHDWPGNVRELRNLLERAVLQCTDGVLRLPEPLGLDRPAPRAPAREPHEMQAPADETLAAIERKTIIDTLRRTRGKVSGAAGAASVLGMNPNTLRSRMKKLGIRMDRAFE